MSTKLQQSNIKLAATEEDRPPQLEKLPWTDIKRPDTIESATIHELGHHQFQKLGFD